MTSPLPLAASSDSRPPGKRSLLRLIVLGMLCAAPVPGDIGSCGQEAQELDPALFFRAKKAVDCDRCSSCAFLSETCRAACDRSVAWETEFPEGCLPLVHDGEVCLRALLYASCAEYGTYVDDDRPEAPSECNFCPDGERPR